VAETNAFLQDTLSNAIWHRFPATGHLVNIERAEEFNQLLAEFIRKSR
jgi:pimeloyl-ACP methyl ester carboxylesterase